MTSKVIRVDDEVHAELLRRRTGRNFSEPIRAALKQTHNLGRTRFKVYEAILAYVLDQPADNYDEPAEAIALRATLAAEKAIADAVLV
jgi:hypothetical protein